MTPSLLQPSEIDTALQRISPHIVRTSVLASQTLSSMFHATVFLKPELFQNTGSFKVRGVFNKVLGLSDSKRNRGLIAFSAGNHAMAVAFVGKQLGVDVTVCMPAAAVAFKVDAVRALGADLELVEGDLVAHVMSRQADLGATLIHPFDDRAIISGTATIGREILEDLNQVETIIVPVGGGGLISGIAAAAKQANPAIRLIGVEPATADVVRRSQAAGFPTPHPGPSSLADGLNAPVTGQINLDHIEAYVDEMILIDESSLRPAWQSLLDLTKLAGEPAAAAGLAALQTGQITLHDGESVCLVISGGNADFDKLSD